MDSLFATAFASAPSASGFEQRLLTISLVLRAFPFGPPRATTQSVQAKTGIRKAIMVAALLLATAAAAPRLVRALAARYPAIAVIEILWKAPR